ncbi:hypothetical protein [Flagellimonas crocea]|uniref:hypothetical protein n=1 Tax=Flagellimonas crocea TaxID=3067311 RepID=UPI00296F4130|nr:hypothetical protein [Muricauda sp. DH64]
MFGKTAFAPLVVIIISAILFGLNIYEQRNGNGSIWGILSNILLILAMIFVIREKKEKG